MALLKILCLLNAYCVRRPVLSSVGESKMIKTQFLLSRSSWCIWIGRREYMWQGFGLLHAGGPLCYENAEGEKLILVGGLEKFDERCDL